MRYNFYGNWKFADCVFLVHSVHVPSRFFSFNLFSLSLSMCFSHYIISFRPVISRLFSVFVIILLFPLFYFILFFFFFGLSLLPFLLFSSPLTLFVCMRVLAPACRFPSPTHTSTLSIHTDNNSVFCMCLYRQVRFTPLFITQSHSRAVPSFQWQPTFIIQEDGEAEISHDF